MPLRPLVHELIPDPDPWDVARKLAHLPHLCFLDSSDRHPTRGRYSYVMADPKCVNEVDITDNEDLDPLRVMPQFFNKDFVCPPLFETTKENGLPPFQGGVVGAFGYGLQRATERIAKNKTVDFAFCEMLLCRYDWVISFDHLLGRAWLIAFNEDDLEFAQEAIQADVFPHPCTRFEIVDTRAEQSTKPISNFSRLEYLNAIQKTIDYIHAGDVFQVNLSQRLLAPLTEHPLDVYGRLRQVCPSPFGVYFDAGDFQILSSSPEQFLQLSPTGEVVTRPIKGTRPRGKTPEEDAALLRDLTTNPKDRAENVMIVDLMRNDLGRVCEYGSVTVPKVCEVESHNYVHHLVSEVRGQLSPGKNAFDLLKACFPGGSVTGAPKVRAMEIIAELEPTARGPYCGSMGWIGFDGAMDSNILIRTMTASKGLLQFPVGGGIVADSDPEREYEETLHKAAGMLKTLKRD